MFPPITPSHPFLTGPPYIQALIGGQFVLLEINKGQLVHELISRDFTTNSIITTLQIPQFMEKAVRHYLCFYWCYLYVQRSGNWMKFNRMLNWPTTRILTELNLSYYRNVGMTSLKRIVKLANGHATQITSFENSINRAASVVTTDEKPTTQPQ